MKSKVADTNSTKKPKEVLFSFRERLLISFLSVFSFVFVLMIFGPIDIFAANIEEIKFTLMDFLPLILGISLAVTVLASLYVSALRSALFNVVTALLLILPVCGTLQLLLFNSAGKLTGDVSELSSARRILLIVFWVIAVALILWTALVSKRRWKQIVMFVAIFTVGMNGASLITDFVARDITEGKSAAYSYVPTNKDLLSLSGKENIVILLVDRLDNEYIKEAFNQFPLLKAQMNVCLEGFTYYTGATSLYGQTFPAVPYLITGNDLEDGMIKEDYIATAYKESDFISDLRQNGYGVNLYIKDFYTFRYGSELVGVADNLAEVTGYTANKGTICSYLLRLSVARYIPQNWTFLSYLLSVNSPDVRMVEMVCGDDGMYYADDAELYSALCSTGLSINESMNKNYTFLHLQGAHAPYYLTADCTRSNTTTDVAQQSAGSLKLVLEYIEQMKKLGIYDSSTIIITADHGANVDDYSDRLTDKLTAALFVKPKNAERCAMKYSSAQVSHTNFLATIVESAGIKTDNDYGRSIFDIPEGENILRRYNKSFYKTASEMVGMSKYEIYGDANDFANWKYIKTVDIVRKPD